MDQYVSWGLPTDQLTLDTIWRRFQEFCKPQSNEGVQDLTFSQASRQESHSVDEWYNAVQAQVNLVKYPPKTANILHRDIFRFSCEMRSLSPEPSVMEV